MIYAVSLVNNLADLIGIHVFRVKPKDDTAKQLITTKSDSRNEAHGAVELNIQN